MLQLAFDLAFGNEIARMGGPWPMSQKCWQWILYYPISRAKARRNGGWSRGVKALRRRA